MRQHDSLCSSIKHLKKKKPVRNKAKIYFLLGETSLDLCCSCDVGKCHQGWIKIYSIHANLLGSTLKVFNFSGALNYHSFGHLFPALTTTNGKLIGHAKWSSSKVSALRLDDCEFDSQPGHTEDRKSEALSTPQVELLIIVTPLQPLLQRKAWRGRHCMRANTSLPL